MVFHEKGVAPHRSVWVPRGRAHATSSQSRYPMRTQAPVRGRTAAHHHPQASRMQHAHTLNGRHLLDTGSARRRCSFHRRRSRQATMVRPPEPSPAASRRPAPTWARPCAPPVWLVAGRRLRICPARTGRCLRTRGHRDRARGDPLPAACAPAGVLHSRRRSSSRVPCLRPLASRRRRSRVMPAAL